jgi:hypothetical protein
MSAPTSKSGKKLRTGAAVCDSANMRSSVLLGASLLIVTMATGGCGGGTKGARDAAPTDSPIESGNAGDTAKLDASTSDASDATTSEVSTSDASDAGTPDVGASDASDASDVGTPDVGASDASDSGRSCVDAGGVDAGGACFGALALFNTGVDAAGVSLAGGSVDPHYKLIQSADPTFTGPDAIVVSQIAEGYWVPQSATSKWIAPSANQQYPGATPCNAAGTYVFRTTFDLAGFDPATAMIAGQWGADNSGAAVRLNGVSLGITAGSYAPLTAFTITSGFVAGTNTLDFEILDSGCPNGLRVELSGVAAFGG